MIQSPINSTQSRKFIHKMDTTRDDSEGEDIEHKSDSDKMTTDQDSSTSDEESSSDWDEAELEKRRTECQEVMYDLETQFSTVKESLFREKITQVDDKLFEIRSGRAQEYLQPLAQLQENMKIRTEVAAILKQFSITSVQSQIEAETTSAQQNLQSEQKLLFDAIQEELENEIRRLEEDRNNIDVSSALWGTEQQTRRRKPVSVAGPYIIYMLNDADILSDLTVIKKALTASKRKSSVH